MYSVPIIMVLKTKEPESFSSKASRNVNKAALSFCGIFSMSSFRAFMTLSKAGSIKKFPKSFMTKSEEFFAKGMLETGFFIAFKSTV